MKKSLNFKTLLIAIGLLVMSINQVLAGSFVSGVRIYFDNSQWHWGTVKVHCWNGSSNEYYQGYQIAGSDYWYIDLGNWGWQGWQFEDNSSHYSNVRYDEPRSDWWTACLNTDDQTWTLIGPKNVAISNTTTEYGGSGTEEDPYIVKAGVAITCSASADKIDSNTTIEYSYDGGSNYSSTATHTVESNPSHNGEYSASVTIRTYRGSNHSRAFTKTIYYKAINIYAGLTASASPAAAASAGYPTISANYVTAGSTVDVVAGAAKTGYTWSTWSSSNGTFGTATNASTTFQPSADNAVAVANFTENISSITINAATTPSGTGGSVTTGAGTNIPLGIATSRSVVASNANTNYYFTGWTVVGHAVVDAPSSKSTTVRTDGFDGGTGTATATYASRYAIAGSENATGNPYGELVNGTPGWGENGYPKTFDYDADNDDYRVTLTLKGNTGYKFKVRDKQENADYGVESSGVTIEGDTKWFNASTNDATFTLNGSDDIIFKIVGNGGNHVQVHIQTSDGSHTAYTATYNSQTFYGDGTNATSTNGGTVEAVDGKGFKLGTGEKVKAGGSVTFTAKEEDGYRFRGWYSDASCTTPYKGTSGATVSGENDKILTLSGIGANKTVYAKFEEVMSYISMFTTRGTFRIDDGEATSSVSTPYLQVGVHTTHTVTIVSVDEGCYFAGWDLHTTEGDELNTTISGSGESNTTITVTGLGHTSGHVLDFLRPDIKDLDKVYFRNWNQEGGSALWSQVYVYFSTGEEGWSGDGKCAKTNASDGYKALMTQAGSTNVYWAYVPRATTKGGHQNIAFSNTSFGTNFKFNDGEAVMRADYKAGLDMFVPQHSGTETKNNTTYYKGYWKHHNVAKGSDAKYYMKHFPYGGSTYSDANDGNGNCNFTVVDENTIAFNLRIDNMVDYNNMYAVNSNTGIKYITNPNPAVLTGDTVKPTHCENLAMTEWNNSTPTFVIKPTAEGIYNVTIDQSGDVMRLSVNYPLNIDDYIIEHTYTGRNKGNTEDSTYTTRSNVIKYATAADSARYSLFINNAGATLKLRKCTAISGAGVPTWTEVDEDSNTDNISDGLAAIMTKVGTTPGVYEFDLKVDKTNNVVGELKNIALYSGNYYIKTDSAAGGWVNYKDNAMDKNTVTFDRTAATFDNYWCHYYYTNAGNIKCVIANEYCNQLSDTIKGDGIARMSGKEPFVPKAGTSIRFSYNSATNTIGRAYLDQSLADSYLNIVPNASGKVFNLEGTDLYDKDDDNYEDTRFDDKLNWVYEKEVLVVPGAQAGVSAIFTDASSVDHHQTFLPKTYTLLDGTGKGKYHVRVVYDFKTNYMMAAFLLPDSAITAALSDFDMLWVRHKDYSPAQIKLGSGGSLSNVRVIGAIELRYDSVHQNGSGSGHVSMNTWGPDNRPFLKYFVSFPFDVHVSSIFGLNQARLGYDYDIQKYDGAARAKDGLFFGDGDNYWINLTKDSVMHANEGYCVIFDNEYVRGSLGHIWDNKDSGSKVYLYFPADEELESIVTDEGPSTVPAHQCNVNRFWAQYAERNHMQTDSHWNLIGNPLFHDAHIKSTVDGVKDSTLHSYYKLDYSDNKWKAVAITKESTPFKAMSSVLVQWCGDITWTAIPDPSPIVARRVNAENKNYLIQLDVEFNGAVSDWAYVQLREGSEADFKLCEDMYKMYNKGIPQIYTFAGAYDVAYNDVPIQNQTIPVGIVTRKNGTYKFSMPTNFSGTVTLIDKFAQTRTNLNIEDYEVYLEKGTIEDRFELEININNAPTAIDGVEDGEGTLKDGKAHKFIMNDMMYILRDGEIFDARGNRVK